MGSPLTSSNFRRLLDKRLRMVDDDTRKRRELESMIPKLTNRISSDKAWEEYFSVTGVPDIPSFNGKLTTLNVYPGFHKKIEAAEFGAQVVAQRKLMDDKKYTALDNIAEGLRNSAHRVQEKKLVRIFSNITSVAFDFMTSEEGVSLASSSHTTKADGVSTATGFDNAGTSAMNATSIAATRLLMRRFRSDIGERFETGNNLAIICPDNLADTAEEVNRTPKSLNTAEGNVNMQANRYTVIPYPLLDESTTTSWGMVDMDAMKKDLIWIDRIKPESKRTIDWSTYALQQAIYTRFAVGFIDWRWIFWNTV